MNPVCLCLFYEIWNEMLKYERNYATARWIKEARPVACLRGVLVKWSTNEAFMPFGALCRILSLHPAAKFPLHVAGRGRRPLGPGQSLP